MFVILEGFFRVIAEFFPGKVHWNLDDIPDQSGKVVIITGANTGIGFETAKALLRKNATVYIGCRSLEKGNEAIEKLRNVTKNSKVHLFQIDLADLKSVQHAAKEFQKKEDKLHILINNAGLLDPPMEALTPQGYDLQFGTNVLGPYLFAKLLTPLLEKTAASLPPSQPARIVELTSASHYLNPCTGAAVISYESLRDGPARNKWSGVQLYCHSKSAVLLVAKARARLLHGHNIISMSVDPGYTVSGLNRNRGAVEVAVGSKLGWPTEMGAINPCYVSTFPDVSGLNGAYFGTWARIKSPRSDHVDNIEAEDKLVAWLEEQLRVNNVV